VGLRIKSTSSDTNAVLIAARILGYGKEYEFKYTDSSGNEKLGKIDLSKLDEKVLDESLVVANINEFSFVLPNTDNTVTFKLLTHSDENSIEAEIKGLKKINPNGSFDVTTRLKYIITSINGKRDLASIRDFVDNYLMAKDARELRNYYSKVSPDIELKYYPEDENYTGEGIEFPISINFFWPDVKL
jgi:hypothetical protein